ncbi:LPXTG cell wall anchor domain-containing protein [Microbacterium koreense]|uniref:LPXTG cell wall anchor domain-containing protein n=1 Tax=Microbacterium koreense TaxID=323761 RepID=A0ABW2ZSE6_9MICO
MRRIVLTSAIAAALLISSPFAAAAVEDNEGYTPVTPSSPSLAGSTVQADCQNDVPWISYNVQLVDPDAQVTSTTAYLVMTNGAQTHEIELGQLQDNRLSGSILWPGASVTDGVADGWPGWTRDAAGEWVETDGNFRWTRGDISASIRVNPELQVRLAYPEATADCYAGPRDEFELPLTDGGAQLPATGMDAVVLPAAIVGGVALVTGGALLFAYKRRRA